MRCEDVEKIVFSGESVSEQTREAMQAHAAHCQACRMLMENADVLAGAREMDEAVQVPASFAKGWRVAVRSEAKKQPSFVDRAADWLRGTFGQSAVMRGAAYALSAVVLLGVGAQLGSGGLTDAVGGVASGVVTSNQKAANSMLMSRSAVSTSYAMDYGVADVVMEEALEAETGGAEQKIVRTAQLSLKTEDMDAVLAAIEQKTAEVGGSITYCEVSGTKEEGRWASLQLSIPSPSLDAFLNSAGALGTVTREVSSSRDLTEEYYDNESRLESAQAKKAQLDALYAQATDMDDVIAITDALFDVQAEIEDLTGANRSIDNRVDYSQVSLTIDETPPEEEPEKVPLLTQLLDSMKTGVEELGLFATNLLLFIAWAAPWLAVIAALAAVAYGIGRKIRRRR